jgi:hypothetical protein
MNALHDVTENQVLVSFKSKFFLKKNPFFSSLDGFLGVGRYSYTVLHHTIVMTLRCLEIRNP